MLQDSANQQFEINLTKNVLAVMLCWYFAAVEQLVATVVASIYTVRTK